VIKHTIRRHAEDLCTEQLGFRTINDAIESERREINAFHVTSLDREIQKRMTPTSGEFAELELAPPSGVGLHQLHAYTLTARLHFLVKLDLAAPRSQKQWDVTRDFHQALRCLQSPVDRQRSLAEKSGSHRAYQRDA
jgi:hypothetical protein